MAEYFRDVEKQDVLLFVDNIFRFTQAGSEVSALLGRMPSAVGYQPTLATEMGELQERITSTEEGSITSVQAIYVPADDLTDPAPATAFTHLDARPCSRVDRRAGHLPGGRPARLDAHGSWIRSSSVRRTTVSRTGAGRFCSATRISRTSSRFSEWTSSTEEDKVIVAGLADPEFLSQPFFVAEQFTGIPGKYVPLEETVESFGARRRRSTTTCPSRRSTWGGIEDVVAQRLRELAKLRARWPTAALTVRVVSPANDRVRG